MTLMCARLLASRPGDVTLKTTIPSLYLFSA